METTLTMATSNVAKRLIVVAYGVIAIISALGVVSAVQSWSTVPISTWLRFDGLSHSFVPMLVFIATALWRQIKTKFSWALFLQVLLVGGLLGGSAINHAFPEKAIWYAFPHLVLALVFIGVNLGQTKDR